MIDVYFTPQAMVRVKTQVLLTPVFSDLRPLIGAAGRIDWRLNGFLSRILQGGRFNGCQGETMLMPSSGRLFASSILVFGLGASVAMKPDRYASLFDGLLKPLIKMQRFDVAIRLSDFIPEEFDWRNAVRLLVFKAFDYPTTPFVFHFSDLPERIREAKRRRMDFGPQARVTYLV